MKLKDYIKTIPLEERDVFSAKCGTSFAHIRNIAYGYKKSGESLCINIERESGGTVKCEELRPDVDWKYLRGTFTTFKLETTKPSPDPEAELSPATPGIGKMLITDTSDRRNEELRNSDRRE
ncbi:YdaS family helix-turn-helix protein [Nitrosomonas sp. Nm132]|jgi:DNA-binding transcriptional regulator YdaS (Cro superfamily)|uniref:YdaS family helix-turn-helix protein n=1 Tax=Nitrosomonas sp. Nm132 TaxID=1881053 RepID=UPI000B818976|nr:YdaS family helix-turn-helix protein [Nitrosomonas sp. Nm132]